MRVNLKILRIKLHLTQAEMAEKLGVTRQTYSNVESGKRSGKNEFWNALQKAFNIPDNEMFALMKVE